MKKAKGEGLKAGSSPNVLTDVPAATSGLAAAGDGRTPGVLAQVAPGKVRASATNPRKVFEAGAMGELTESVRQHGVLQPLIVRRITVPSPSPQPSPLGRGSLSAAASVEYELVAGERRWRAAKAAGLAAVPVMVMELTDAEVIEVQYLENLQRVDLSVLEEAEGFAALIASGKYTAESLAAKLGKSRSHVFGRLKLCKLSGPVRVALEKGTIEAQIAATLVRIPDPKKQAQCLKEALGGNWDSGDQPFSVRELREHIEEEYQRELKSAPWDLKREFGPLGSVFACEACPKRSGNMLEEFPEFKGSLNVCTDTTCYERKLEMWTKVRIEEARKAGQEVLDAKGFEKARYSGRYQNLEDRDYSGSRERTYRQLIKGTGVKTVLAVDEEGNLQELVARADLEKAGVKKKPADSYAGKNRKEQQEKREAREVLKAVRAQVMPLIDEAALKPVKGPAIWRCLAVVAAKELDWEGVALATEMFKLPKSNHEKGILKHVEGLKKEEDLRAAALVLFALRGWMSFYQAEFGESFEVIAAWAGVDTGKLVKAERAAREKKKGSQKATKGTKKLPQRKLPQRNAKNAKEKKGKKK